MAADSSAEEEDAGQSGIACAPCRRRKRKCDRLLPVCSQCLGRTSRCNYPNPTKRGIPLGYVARLERRLAETEAALHHALGRMLDGPSPANDPQQLDEVFSQASIFHNKGDMMRDWDQFPLKSPPDLLAWHRSRSGLLLPGSDQRTTASPAIENSDMILSRENEDSRLSLQGADTDGNASRVATLVGDGTEEVPGLSPLLTTITIPDSNELFSSRADSLARSYPNLYF